MGSAAPEPTSYVAAVPRPASHPADLPQWTRSYEQERREGASAMRGLVFGLLFSLPIWGLIGAGVWWVVSLFS